MLRGGEDGEGKREGKREWRISFRYLRFGVLLLSCVLVRYPPPARIVRAMINDV